MASEVVCGLTFRLLLPVCLTAGTSLPPSLRGSLGPPAVAARRDRRLGGCSALLPPGISPFPPVLQETLNFVMPP